MTVKSLDERKKDWEAQDKELEQFCRFPDPEVKQKKIVVDVPDPWNVALSYVDGSERRHARSRQARNKRSTKKTAAPPRILRLPPSDAADLEFYFNEFEGLCGLRSNWQACAEAMHECSECGYRFTNGSLKKCPSCNRPRGTFSAQSYMRVKSGQGSSWHPDIDSAAIGLVMSRDMDRANRARDALVQMVDDGRSVDVMVLYRVYGPQNPFAPFMQFGDLAQLADLTSVAERGANKTGMSAREFLDKHLRAEGGNILREAVKMSAQNLLAIASDKYMRVRAAQRKSQ